MPGIGQTDREQTVASLAKGIIEDSQTLLREELALARRELLTSFIKSGRAGAFLLGALPFLGLGTLLIGFMLVDLLRLHVLPAQEWACYAIVGVLFLLLTVGLAYGGANRLLTFHFLPRQTVHNLHRDAKAVAAALSAEPAPTVDHR